MLGIILGRWFDKKGVTAFFYGFLAFAILLGALAFSDLYVLKLCVAFCVGVVLELLWVGSNELITACANPQHFGRVGGVMHSVYNAGEMIGPVLVGILIDWQGLHLPFFILAILMLVMAGLFLVAKNNLFPVLVTNAERYHHKVHQRSPLTK